MKSKCVLAVLPLLWGCGSSSGEMIFDQNTPPKHQKTPQLVPPTQLVPGDAAVVGLTSSNWVVYRTSDSLAAVQTKSRATSKTITDKAGAVLIRGPVVYNFANVDWTANLGDLSIWTPESGAHEIGQAMYAEGMISASADGSAVVYAQNATASSVDLMIAPSDLSAPTVLIPGMGRGSETTCTPNLSFVGQSLFIAWCTVGSESARLERYDLVGGAWVPTLLADGALPNWSADADGKRVFYNSDQYEGYFVENGNKTFVDKGIGDAVMVPDGSVLLYSVGDQYRRSALPNVNPIPIVVTKYAQRAGFTPDYGFLMYSTTVNYDQGTHRDLLLARTDGLNATPDVLVADPVASVGRSVFTQNGKWAVYFMDVTPTGGTLVVQPVEGGASKQLPNVVEVAAAHDGTIVYTANQTDPEKYPVMADLFALDLDDASADPKLLEAKTIDGHGFQVDTQNQYVIYERSDPDGAGPETDALFFQSVP